MRRSWGLRNVSLAFGAIALLLGAACGSSKSSAGGSATTAASSFSTSTLVPGGAQTPFNGQSFGGGFGLGAPTSIGCLPVPRSTGAIPAWVPADLLLPPGTTLTTQLADIGKYHRAVFVTIGRPAFVRFVLNQWPAKGWTLGRGDSEAGESEDSFAKSGVGGAFRTRDAYCDPTRSELLLVFGTTG
jgi:hypothetical protein